MHGYALLCGTGSVPHMCVLLSDHGYGKHHVLPSHAFKISGRLAFSLFPIRISTELSCSSSCPAACNITTSRDHYRIRIHLSGTMKHLSGFPICNISHAAGIDQIDIRLFTKWHDLIAMLFQNFLHRFCFICILPCSQDCAVPLFS